jgi:hypothetical protein
VVRRVINERRGGGHAPLVLGPREFCEAEAESGDGLVPVVPAGPDPSQRPVASEERRPEHAGAGFQVGARGLPWPWERVQLLLTSEEGVLEKCGAGLQLFVRGLLRCSTGDRSGRGRGRGGDGRRGRGRGGLGRPEARQLFLTGEDLGAKLGDARLQVVAQGLLAGGLSVCGGRPLKDGGGFGCQASFDALLEASLQPSVLSVGECVPQKIGVVPSGASTFRSGKKISVGSVFSSA